MPTVLFLCTGNYYRSRFAEIFFNHLAAERDLDWIADSRGIATSSLNAGPISAATLQGLGTRGIEFGPPRFPLQLTAADLERADRIIALYEPEHRPMLRSNYGGWDHRVEYWQVPDLDELDSRRALERIEQNVRSLVARLEPATVL